ncbi:unnamed protein product, partial [Urochloa humidicola]
PPERINHFRNLLLKTICEGLISVRNKLEEIMELLDRTRGSHTISSESSVNDTQVAKMLQNTPDD